MNKVQELKEKLRQALVVEQTKRNTELEKKFDFTLEHVEELLKLFPKHTKGGGCSDKEVVNANTLHTDKACPRCVLLKMQKENYNPGWVFDWCLRFEELVHVDLRNVDIKIEAVGLSLRGEP